MFFRRERPRVITFGERVQKLKESGFEVLARPDGELRALRDGCAAEISEAAGGVASVGKAGIVIADEIAMLVDLGYQKAFQTRGGKRAPALASQLKALHAFQEDLRELLGLTSLYNESLGTTNDAHLYDRVEGRDTGAGRAWERR